MENRIKMRSEYSRFAFRAGIFLLVGTVLQMLIGFLLRMLIAPAYYQAHITTFSFLNTICSVYILAFGLFVFLSRKEIRPAGKESERKPWRFVLWIPITAGLYWVGNYIGTALDAVIKGVLSVSAQSVADANTMVLSSSPALRILVLSILGPIAEEFIFRKCLIDRVGEYSEGVAILISAILSGLYQGNVSNFFFGLFAGAFFAYIYLRTGKIWYTVILHMFINTATGGITLFAMEALDQEKLARLSDLRAQLDQSLNTDRNAMEQYEALKAEMGGALAFYNIWTVFFAILCMAGVILLFILLVRRKVVLKKTEDYVPKGILPAVFNPGMLLYLAAAAVLFVLHYLRMMG